MGKGEKKMKKYSAPEMEIRSFEVLDAVNTTSFNYGENELPFAPFNNAHKTADITQ